jgi:hypothetical protein
MASRFVWGRAIAEYDLAAYRMLVHESVYLRFKDKEPAPYREIRLSVSRIAEGELDVPETPFLFSAQCYYRPMGDVPVRCAHRDPKFADDVKQPHKWPNEQGHDDPVNQDRVN